MKRNFLLLLALCPAVLAGCSADNGNGELKSALEKAKVSVNLNGNLNSMYIDDGENDDEGSVDFTITDSFFQYRKQFKEISGGEMSFSYDLIKGEDDLASYQTLSLKNEVVTQKLEIGSKKVTVNYDSYFKNPFSNLKAKDFTKVEDRFELNEEKLNEFAGLISIASMTRYSYFDFEIAKVSLAVSNEKITDVNVTTKPRYDTLSPANLFLFDCSFSVYCPGEITLSPIETRPHRDEHDELKAALVKLQEKIATKNYTTVVSFEDSEGELGETYRVYSTNEGLFCTFKQAAYPYQYGYNTRSDGMMNRYRYYYMNSTDKSHSKGDIVYESNSKYNNKVVVAREEIEPDFTAFAPEFFVKKGTQFVCTNGDVLDQLKFYTSTFSEKFEDYYDVSKVVFTLENGEVKTWGFVGYDYLSNYTDEYVFSLTDVGTTVLPIDPGTVPEA